MELNHLRVFFEVAKAGSFTAAARKLRISQSALSKSVALLEDRENVKLFQRSKKGVALTSLGTEVYVKCETIFATLTEIELTCAGKHDQPEGPLRFGASDHVVNYLMVDYVQKMRQTYPAVTPSVFSGTPNDIIGMMMNNEIEFGLFFTKVNVPGIVYEPIANLKMAVVCSPKVLPSGKADGTIKQLKSILQDVGFISSIHMQYQKQPSKDLTNLLGEEPRIAFESNSQEMQKRLCIEKGGVAYLARFMVEKEIESGKLIEIRLPKPIILELHLATRQGRELSLNARTLLGQIEWPK